MRKATLRLAAVTFMAAISFAAASETTIPEAFHGVWQPAELGAAPTCLPNDSDIRQTVTAKRIDFHEGICQPSTITATGAESLRLVARCEQEDSSWEARQEWFVRTIGGRRYLSIRSLDPKRPHQADLGLCLRPAASTDAVSVPLYRPGPLPFRDGRYVTDEALCGLSEQQMLERHGDMLGAMVRVIDGPSLTNAYEMQCTVSDARVEGDDVRFRARCGREGQVDTVNGRYHRLSPTSFRLGQRTFTLCGTDAPRVRNASTCYRAGGSELKIRPNADGSVHIDIESVQGNAHICSLRGTASRTNVGYEYSARLDDGRQCRLAILLDGKGGVAFKDPDWTCKQYHCGARAAFEHIEFGPEARLPCT